jgi:uncharacterized glyoxalase superfamily protein PhnB
VETVNARLDDAPGDGCEAAMTAPRPGDATHAADQPLSADALAVSLTVADARRSAAWYRDVLGFTVDREHERDGRVIAVSMSAGAVRILLGQDDGAKGTDRVKGVGFSVQITTRQDVYAIAERARRAGATFDTEPQEVMGARAFRLRDPDGFRLVVSAPRHS